MRSRAQVWEYTVLSDQRKRKQKLFILNRSATITITKSTLVFTVPTSISSLLQLLYSIPIFKSKILGKVFPVLSFTSAY